MPLVKCIGHTELEALAQIMRPFYGPVKKNIDSIQAGSDDVLIESRLVSLGQKVAIRTLLDGVLDQEQECLPAKAISELKRQLHCVLEKTTSISLPWGSLTGVRPTQIAWESYRKAACDKKKALLELTEYWRLTPAKARLGLETALAEESILQKLKASDTFVYAGVPFCPGRCSYCSFISQDAQRQAKWLRPYVDAMIQETKEFFTAYRRPVRALYLGGGTPTSLNDHDFADLLSALVEHIPLDSKAEFTVEAGRPDTITAEKLALIKAAGANRICINPQTMNDVTLKAIGRNHTGAQTIRAYHLARDYGFKHINMDLIAGLPGEGPEEFLQSLSELIQLAPESITIHTLALKRGSYWHQEQFEVEEAYRATLLPQAWLTKALEQAHGRLKAGGWLPYYLYRQKQIAGALENTGFARQGNACIYNVAMMSDRFDVIGLGSGAISKRIIAGKAKRVANSKDLLDYQQRIEELTAKKITLFAGK